jgi:hypothetical protein
MREDIDMKLYTVRVEFETVVYAEDEKSAEREAIQAVKWEDEEPDQVWVEELEKGDELPYMWTEDCYPWGDKATKTIKQILEGEE